MKSERGCGGVLGAGGNRQSGCISIDQYDTSSKLAYFILFNSTATSICFPSCSPFPLPFPPPLFYEYPLYRLRVACQSSIWQIAENTIAETQTTFKCCYTLEQVEGERQVGVANGKAKFSFHFARHLRRRRSKLLQLLTLLLLLLLLGH